MLNRIFIDMFQTPLEALKHVQATIDIDYLQKSIEDIFEAEQGHDAFHFVNLLLKMLQDENPNKFINPF